ncbi:hypothetical protein P168DRAFT_325533 [Aspergillus campestris IBT 28561]|uniref:DUF202 domain-containing protein n=1 Tax=Aspergillus campestris (strain IBT 28561) TaxID=1392248 RepID=A0A2I1DA09_ASPC2|nr:uncharacterized protein P168DRAFT_325533 [Aspergillus campestris IBT 28561]PKY06698.1 hypothetical protein P168DRAFT_325533 [Aspergillus campestris IBT 28561]
MTTNATPPPDLELSDLPRPPSSSSSAPSSQSQPQPQHQPKIALKRRISTWWVTTVRPVLRAEEDDPRDYLALERTHLAYIRTSNAIASFAVVTAQLFVLHSDTRVVGKAFACAILGLAIYVTLDGAVRYFRLQERLHRGVHKTWNWDLGIVTGGFVGIAVVSIVLVYAFD